MCTKRWAMGGKNHQNVVVIGGGAAGFFAAIHAAGNPALSVQIVERSGKLLSKVKISGGGRCNVTHACFRISRMAEFYPRGRNFVKKIFHEFFTTDTIRWFEQRGVLLKTEADGRMFPLTNRSQSIIDCLLKEAAQKNIQIRTHAGVAAIQQEKGRFRLQLSDGSQLSADTVVVACGGLPKLQMFDWLSASGHRIEPPVPSLFTFNLPAHPITRLMGVSKEKVTIRIPGTRLRETGPLLITHWGLSGPAVLRLSAWGARILQEKNWQFPLLINWLPEDHEETLRQKLQQFRQTRPTQRISHKNPFGLPQRLWQFLLLEAAIADSDYWGTLRAKNQNKLIKSLCTLELSVSGKTTFKEEFVTAGGISLSEVDSRSMESKRVKGLYFAGEVLDIDGVTGGFNFQNAWTTGYIAGKSIAEIGNSRNR